MTVRQITDFFKPFTIPKNRVPVNADIADEIIVATSPRRQTSRQDAARRRQPASPPRPRGRPAREQTLSQSSALSSLSSTPSRGTPARTRTPRKQSAIPSLDGSADDELYHSSPRSSQQRVMSAVEIPSPRPMRLQSPKPPPRPQFVPQAGLQASRASTSFSSISTLSSVPLSSQTSSRRVLVGGVQAVTNSDSGSAEDSDEELPDVASFLPPRKKMKMTPPGRNEANAIDIQDTVKPARKSKRLSDQGSRSGRSTPRQPSSPPRTVYRHSLMNLVKQHEKREKTEARIAEAEAAVLEAEQRRMQAAAKAAAVDGQAMAVAMADDSDEGDRMMQAMERTEALQDEERFYFFEDASPKAENVPFPAVTDQPWAHILNDERAREQACLTGFVTDLAATRRLSWRTVRWFASQLVHEAREDLCEAYAEIVAQHLGFEEDILSRSEIADLRSFYVVAEGNVARSDTTATGEGQTGTSNVQHTLQGAPKPEIEGGSQRANRAPGLKYVAHLLRHSAIASEGLNEVGLSRALHDLVLANVDEDVKGNPNLRNTIQDSIKALCDSPHVDAPGIDEISRSLSTSLLGTAGISRSLQCCAISALPAYSIEAHHLRRSLALSCILGEHDVGTFSSAELSAAILTQIKTAPEFIITELTDYTLLGHLIEVLDIAIDAGFSDFAFLTKAKPTKSNGPFTKSAGPSAGEKAFDAQIDALTKQLRGMASRIKDAGATHLRRMEAKAALERLVVRLEHSVRTRPKPKKGVFAGSTGQKTNFLDGFLNKEGTDGQLDLHVVDEGLGDVGAQLDGANGKDERNEEEVAPVETLSDQEPPEPRDAEDDTVGGAGVEADPPPVHEKKSTSAWDLSGAVRF